MAAGDRVRPQIQFEVSLAALTYHYCFSWGRWSCCQDGGRRALTIRFHTELEQTLKTKAQLKKETGSEIFVLERAETEKTEKLSVKVNRRWKKLFHFSVKLVSLSKFYFLLFTDVLNRSTSVKMQDVWSRSRLYFSLSDSLHIVWFRYQCSLNKLTAVVDVTQTNTKITWLPAAAVAVCLIRFDENDMMNKNTHTGRERRSLCGWRDKRCRSDSRSGNTTAPERETEGET